MDEATLTLLRQARNLPVLDQFELWEALSHALFEDALTGEGSFDEQPVMTLDARVAALDDAARALGQAAATASRVSRSAEATVHALAARHHTVHRERDGITWESMDDRDYPLPPGEFAADELSAALDVTSTRAETIATDAERLRRCLRPLLVKAGAGRARMSSVLKVSDALEHLDDEQIAAALPHLLRAKAVTAGPRAATNRTAGVLDALGLAPDADEIDLRAELGVWFIPHPSTPRCRSCEPSFLPAMPRTSRPLSSPTRRSCVSRRPTYSTVPCTTRSALCARTPSSCSRWPTCT